MYTCNCECARECVRGRVLQRLDRFSQGTFCRGSRLAPRSCAGYNEPGWPIAVTSLPLCSHTVDSCQGSAVGSPAFPEHSGLWPGVGRAAMGGRAPLSAQPTCSRLSPDTSHPSVHVGDSQRRSHLAEWPRGLGLWGTLPKPSVHSTLRPTHAAAPSPLLPLPTSALAPP